MANASGARRQPAPTPAQRPSRLLRVTWREMSAPMRVLRAMLGVTFLYGGIYKALDGTFFDPTSRGYIGAQIRGFTLNSPIAFLLNHMIERATFVGWVIMLSEFALGIALLVGVWLVPAGIGGAALSLGLWLSASWSVHPYFLSSDPAYLAMWIAFTVGVWPKHSIATEVEHLVERRGLLQAAGVGGLAVIGAAILRPFASTPAAPAASSGSANPSASTSSSAAASSGGSTVSGTTVAKLSDVPVGQAVSFTAPDGNPAWVVRTAQNTVCAYSAVCTHQGCVVQYDPSSKDLICPCHGATYDPANHANVIAGPAPQALQEYKATISGNSIVVS